MLIKHKNMYFHDSTIENIFNHFFIGSSETRLVPMFRDDDNKHKFICLMSVFYEGQPVISDKIDDDGKFEDERYRVFYMERLRERTYLMSIGEEDSEWWDKEHQGHIKNCKEKENMKNSSKT